jgi:hypothetical protein
LASRRLPRHPRQAAVAEILGCAREDALLLLDFASPTQALIKVQVRIATMVFIDYLTWHRIKGRWLITSKGFHLEAA